VYWLAFNIFEYTKAVCQTVLYNVIWYGWNHIEAFIERLNGTVSICVCVCVCDTQHVITTGRVYERVNMYTTRLWEQCKKSI